MTTTTTSVEPPLLYSPTDAARLLGVGRTTLYELLTTGDLPSVKVGRSRRITRAALVRYVERLAA